MADRLLPSPSYPHQDKKGGEDAPALSAHITPSKKTHSRPQIYPRSLTPRVAHIDEKILQLKKKKEKIQMHEALNFLKEAQSIFQEDFSTDRALALLSESWKAMSESQKEEWRKRIDPFRALPLLPHRKKIAPPHPAPHTS